MKTIALILLSFLFSLSEISAQEIIELRNPSLEDIPRAGKPNGYSIRSWFDCNKPGQTFVDVQPGFFSVEKSANDGSTYAGMICRADGTWEGIAQKLKTPLLKNQSYAMSIDLARAPAYISQTNMTGKEENFANPVKLRIFGSNKYCARAELLAESPAIDNEEWKTFAFKLTPKEIFEYITIEAYYLSKSEIAYNGNLLMDNCSAIYPINEESEVQATLGMDINTFSENLDLGEEIKVDESQKRIAPPKEKKVWSYTPATKKWTEANTETKPATEIKKEIHFPKKKEKSIAETQRPKPVKKKPQRSREHIKYTHKFLTEYDLMQEINLLESPDEVYINIGNVYKYCEELEIRSFARYYRNSSPDKIREFAKSLVALEAIEASIYMFELADAKEDESEDRANRLLSDESAQEKIASDLLIEQLKEYVARQK